MNQTDPFGLVIVNRGPTTMHLEPSTLVGPRCVGHVGCTDTNAVIRHRCYQQGDCWRVEFTVTMSIDMWVANDFYSPWKQAVVEAHERGHAAVSERWFNQVVADARTMENYKFCNQDACERKASLFEQAWKWKLKLRQFFYEVLN